VYVQGRGEMVYKVVNDRPSFAVVRVMCVGGLWLVVVVLICSMFDYLHKYF